MTKKGGKQRKRQAPTPPLTTPHESSSSNGQITIEGQTGPGTSVGTENAKIQGYGQNSPQAVFNGKASMPEKPPQEMALSHPEPTKRFCSSGRESNSFCPPNYATGNAAYAFGYGSEVPGNGPLNFHSNFNSGTRMVIDTTHTQTPEEKTTENQEEGWISYVLSFLPFS